MNKEEILKQISKKHSRSDLLNLIQIHSTGLGYYSELSIKNIENKTRIAEMLANLLMCIDLLNKKHPGFKEMIKYEYEEILAKYEIKLKIGKD